MATGRAANGLIAGGSFLMHGMEIHGAAYRLPVTFLLFDNHAHAMCVTREQLFYDDLYSYNRFGPSRCAGQPRCAWPAVGRVDDIGRLPTLAHGAGRRRPVGRQRRGSADEIRRLQTFSATRNNKSIQRRAAPMPCSRLTTLPLTGHCRSDR
jgi:acetolactate synthase-1/2/3 large subunit